VEARDTLGAGDVWHGALAVAMTRERTVTDRIRFANEVAAERVRQVGPRSWTTAIAGRNRT
jgi:ribokinase